MNSITQTDIVCLDIKIVSLTMSHCFTLVIWYYRCHLEMVLSKSLLEETVCTLEQCHFVQPMTQDKYSNVWKKKDLYDDVRDIQKSKLINMTKYKIPWLQCWMIIQWITAPGIWNLVTELGPSEAVTGVLCFVLGVLDSQSGSTFGAWDKGCLSILSSPESPLKHIFFYSSPKEYAWDFSFETIVDLHIRGV